MNIRERVEEFLRSRKGEVFSPTQIGKALGYGYDRASGSVGPALKRLVAEGLVRRVEKSARDVRYEWPVG